LLFVERCCATERSHGAKQQHRRDPEQVGGDTALETALFAAAGTKQGHRRHVEPDWAEVHRELKRKHVTLTMLWDEYIERCSTNYFTL
jgi:transposase